MDFPIKNGGSFHCYVSLPEGMTYFDEVLGGPMAGQLSSFGQFLQRCPVTAQHSSGKWLWPSPSGHAWPILDALQKRVYILYIILYIILY